MTSWNFLNQIPIKKSLQSVCVNYFPKIWQIHHYVYSKFPSEEKTILYMFLVESEEFTILICRTKLLTLFRCFFACKIYPTAYKYLYCVIQCANSIDVPTWCKISLLLFLPIKLQDIRGEGSNKHLWPLTDQGKKRAQLLRVSKTISVTKLVLNAHKTLNS